MLLLSLCLSLRHVLWHGTDDAPKPLSHTGRHHSHVRKDYDQNQTLDMYFSVGQTSGFFKYKSQPKIRSHGKSRT
jgi:hypothetical protein